MNVATPKRRFDFYPLEERVLLSGDALDASEVSPEVSAEEYLQYLADTTADGQSPPGTAATDETEASTEPVQVIRTEVVIVDSSVHNKAALLENLRTSAADGSEIQWIIYQLDPDQDGVEQISNWLSELSGIDAIHLIAHGDSSGIVLGDARLDSGSIAAYAGQIALWGDALASDADLLIYGCDLAAGESGRELIENLAELCGADVAAAINLSGHGVFGGDWVWEYTVGSIETEVLFTDVAQHPWSSVLTVGSTASVVLIDGSLLDIDQIIAAVDPAAALFVYDGSQSASDVLASVTAWASQNEVQIDSLSILSHGKAGAFQLGYEWITAHSLGQSPDPWVALAEYFAAGANIILFGCDVGAGIAGQALIDQLAQVTAADVFASTNATGAGGDWVMEAASFGAETTLAAGLQLALDADLLATTDVSLSGSNTAPVLDSTKSPVLNPVNEDAGAPVGAVGTLISSLVDFASVPGGVDNVTDPDAGALLGIAVVGANSTNGAWWYTTNNGTTWQLLGTVSEASARLLAADANTRLYFQANPNWNGHIADAITFRAWDRTSGTNGGTADLVTPIPVNADVRDNFGTASYANNNGTWAWSTNWIENDIGGGGASGGSIRIVSGQLRFELSDNPGDWIYRQIDLSGATSATLNFTYDNQLDFNNPRLVVFEISSNGGSTYTTLETFTQSINTGTGSRSFNITSFISDQTRIRIRIVDTGSQVSYIFFDNIEIAVSTTIPATGGATAFSAQSDTAAQTVNAVNDAPIFSNLDGNPTYIEGGAPVVLDNNVTIHDVELSAANNFSGATLTLTRSGGAHSQDQFSATGTLSPLVQGGDLIVGGTTIGTVTTNSGGLLVLTFNNNATNASVNQAMQQIAYSNSSQAPPTSVQIDWTFNDGNTGGQGSGGALTAIGSVVVNITLVNDAPLIDNGAAAVLPTTDEKTISASVLVSDILSDVNWMDPDANPLSGIAITQISANGTWQYSLDGTNWTDFGAVSATQALLLTSNSYVRFVPDAMNGETATFSFRAWDRTTGTAATQGAPSYADPGLGGGSSAYSAQTAHAQMIVTDVNDAPAISVEIGDSDSASLIETNSGLSSSGTLTVTDIDNGDAVTAAVTSVVASGTTSGLLSNNAALLAMLGVNQNVIDGMSTSGQINWNFDSGSEAFDYLATGETLVLTYTVTVTDSQSATDTQEITITITGTNDAPLISLELGDSDGAGLGVTGAALAADGTLSVVDFDRSDEVTAAITGFSKSGETAGLTLDDLQLQTLLSAGANVISNSQQSGQIQWVFDSAGYTFAYLGAGETLTLVYTITVTDDYGAIDSHDVTIVITGDNSAPVISVEPNDSDSEALIETDTTLTASGTLTVNDINTTDLVTADVSSVVASGATSGLVPGNAALLAMLGVNPNVIDGVSTAGTLNWDFDSGSEAFDYLAAGEVLTLTYAITVTDSAGATDSHEITITITGTNDAPLMWLDAGDSDGEILGADGTPQAASGAISVEDLDRSDVITAAITGFSKIGNSTGLSLNDGQLQAMLDVGSSVIDNANQQGTLAWQFDSGSETFAYLAQGESLTLVYTVTVTDTQGASDSRDITIVIQGTNTPPQFSIEPGDSAGEAVDETDAGLSTSGTLTVTDANLSDVVTAAVGAVTSAGTTSGLQSNHAALLAMMSVSTAVIDTQQTSGTLSWTFNSGSEAFDYLAAGESLTLVYTVVATDSHGATGTQELTITINGTNDAPVVFVGAGDVDQVSFVEDTQTIVSSGSLSVYDADRSDHVTAAVSGLVVSGNTTGMMSDHAALLSMLSVGAGVIDSSGQSGKLHWSFDSGAEVFSHLWTGSSVVLQYAITVTDSDGAAAGHLITITIHGANEFPIAVADAYSIRTGETLTVDAPGPLANDHDPDGDPLQLILVSGPSYGTLMIAPDGSFSYVPKAGFIGTDTFRYQASDGRFTSQIVEVTISVKAPGGPVSLGGSQPWAAPSSGGNTTVNSGDSAGLSPEDAVLGDGGPAQTTAHREKHGASKTQDDIELAAVSLVLAGDQTYTPMAQRTIDSEPLMVGLLPSLSAIDNLQQRYKAMQELRDDLASAILWGPAAGTDSAASGFAFGLGSVIIGSPGAAAGIVTAGYVLWAARGAALLATLATSMPAWRHLDPATLLADYRASRSTGAEDDQLETMIG